MIAVAITLTAFGLFAFIARPVMNDVTTDFENPLEFKKIESSLGAKYPAKFIELQKKNYPEIGPLILDEPQEKVFRRAINVIEHHKTWKLVHQSAADGEIEFFDTSKLFKFKDDAVVQIFQQSEGKTIVNMRSRSNTGRSDFGINSKRIAEFFSMLKSEDSLGD